MVQAIIENIDIKKAFYKELGKIVKPSGIFASNTSSFEIGFMAEPSGRPDKMVGSGRRRIHLRRRGNSYLLRLHVLLWLWLWLPTGGHALLQPRAADEAGRGHQDVHDVG